MLFANLAAIMMAASPAGAAGAGGGDPGHDRLRGAGHRGPPGGLADRRPGLALGVLGQRPPGASPPWPWAAPGAGGFAGERQEPFDLAGSAVYVLGLGLLLLGLNQGPAWGWSSPATIGCLLLAGLLLAAWVVLELRIPTPMIDLRLFRQRAFSAPVLSAMLCYASISATFLLPFALIQGRGLSPAQVGLVLTCQPVVMAVTASISGPLSDRIGSRAPATVGLLIVSVALFLLSRLQGSTPIAQIAAVLLLTGLGIGLFTSPNSSAVLGAVPAQRRGVANGVLGTARTLGMVLGIGVAGAVYTTTLGAAGAPGPEAILGAAGAGLLVGSGIALLGALTSATRPVQDAGRGA